MKHYTQKINPPLIKKDARRNPASDVPAMNTPMHRGPYKSKKIANDQQYSPYNKPCNRVGYPVDDGFPPGKRPVKIYRFRSTSE